MVRCLLLLCVITSTASLTKAQMWNIKNDVFWNTQDGQPIYSQGGGVFKFADPNSSKFKYYWYGVHYKEAEYYRDSSYKTQTTNTFESVTCYSSDDLVNWKFEGDVVTKAYMNGLDTAMWVGRLGVAYLLSLNQYAMFVQHGGKVLILVADSPLGPFTRHQEISMESMIGTSNTGDQTVFTDEDDGKSYLVYSYGRGRNRIYVSEIGSKNGKIGLMDCTQVFQGESREGNCMFKYEGRYYMCASNIYGWDASYAYYLVADNIRGPYLPANDMQVMNGCSDDFAHVTQTGFFYTIKGSNRETVVYCGDRWADFAGNGLGYNQWMPISFAGTNPYLNSVSSWHLEEPTGLWKVADDNNYIKNGSFEADRNAIPSSVKPAQEQLTGWATVVTEGNHVEVNGPNSPVLNYFNTESDRKQVIGEKSLNISDKVNFQRKVSQIVASSPYVALRDGKYVLTAHVKNSAGFSNLEMYATSGGKQLSYRVEKANDNWQTIEIRDITVSGGKVEVGFLATGEANAFCNIDDVSLVRM